MFRRNKPWSKKAPILVLTLVATGCAPTKSDPVLQPAITRDYCYLDSKVHPAKGETDRLSAQLIDQIDAHNRTFEKLCPDSVKTN